MPSSEAQYVLNQKLGNIGHVVEKSQPLDLTPNSTHGPWSGNNSPSRPSSVQSNSSLGSLGNVLERPPVTIDLSRFQTNTLSSSTMSSNQPWLFPRSTTYVPPPSKGMTNPFLALSMHTARARQRAKEGKSVDTASTKTTNKETVTSVPPMLNIPAGVAAASTISRPPSSARTVPTSNMPTTELTRAPPALLNLGVAQQRVLNYQGGTISIQPSDAHPPVPSRTVLFSGGEPQTPQPQIRIKEEPIDSTNIPAQCASNGGIDEPHYVRSSPGERLSEVDEQQVQRMVASRKLLSTPNESEQENDRTTSQDVQLSNKQLAPPIVIKQEVTSAN